MKLSVTQIGDNQYIIGFHFPNGEGFLIEAPTPEGQSFPERTRKQLAERMAA